MDLGVQIEPQFGFSWADIRAIANDAEIGGFRAVWLSDHLFLRLAAKWAHAFNWLPDSGFPTAAQVGPAMRELDDVCRAAGRDPRSLKRGVFLYALVARTRAEIDTIVAEVAGRTKVAPAEWLAARPGAIVGTPDELRDRFKEYAAAGTQDANVMFPYRYERQMVKLFAAEVLPALRWCFGRLRWCAVSRW